MSSAAVKYIGPSGQRMSNPTEEQLRELVFSTDGTYWITGSGDGALEYENKQVASVLILTKWPPHGFRLLFKDSKADDMMVGIAGEEFNKTLKVMCGGEVIDEPLALFFDEATTFKLVLEFCKTGLIPPEIRWARWVDLDWDENGNWAGGND
jgi:hypothetical protein